MNSKLLAFILLIFLYSSCHKYAPVEFVENSEMLDSYKNSHLEFFQMAEASQKQSFVTKDDVTISFDEHAFTKNSKVFNGKATIEFTIIYDQAGMIQAGFPTVLRSPDDKYHLLTTGGEYFINAKDSDTGETLGLNRNYSVFIPYALTGNGLSEMHVFVQETDTDLFWSELGLLSDSTGTVRSSETFYQVIFNRFGWINCDDFTALDEFRHKIDFKYPNGFDASNAFVFIALENYPNSLANLFIEIPESEVGKLIFIASTDTDHYIAHEDFIMEKDLSIDFSNISTQKVAKEDADDLLQELLMF